MPTHSSDADTTTSTIAIYDIEELTGEPIQKDLYFIVGLTRQSKIMSRRLCDMLKMVGRQEQSAIVHAFVDDVSDLSDDDLEYVEFVTFDVVGLMEDVFYALKDIVEKMWRSNVCRSISFIFGWSIENKSEKANELIVEILKNRPTVRMFFAYGREDVISNDVPRYPASIISDLKAVTVGNYQQQEEISRVLGNITVVDKQVCDNNEWIKEKYKLSHDDLASVVACALAVECNL